MRLRNDPKAKEILENDQSIFINDPISNKGQWNLLFDNNNPIYLEVGSGKGQFIIENAIKYPHINFIGIEKNTVVCSKIIKKYYQKEYVLKNLKIINLDAKLISDVFSNGEINKIYLNFSDPWPKKRHVKNRLTSDRFLSLYADILTNDGIVEFKSDNDNLYAYTLEQLTNHKQWEIVYHTNDLYSQINNNFNKDNIATEYEQRFVGLNKNINKVIFKRR